MMRDLKQVDLKQVRDDVADRVGRAAKELSSGAGNAARELGASAESSISTQVRKQAKLARSRMPRRGAPSSPSTTSGTERGRRTSAADGIVRPQPDRSRTSPGI